jgi:hypothetical protein
MRQVSPTWLWYPASPGDIRTLFQLGHRRIQPAQTTVSVGVRWAPFENLFIDGSLARQGGSGRGQLVTVGVKFVF